MIDRMLIYLATWFHKIGACFAQHVRLRQIRLSVPKSIRKQRANRLFWDGLAFGFLVLILLYILLSFSENSPLPWDLIPEEVLGNAGARSVRATFVAANTGAYDMNAGQNFTTITTGPTVLSFTNITNGQSGLIDFNNTLAGAVTVAGTYITGSGTLLTTISAAGVYTLGYYSPDGVNVRITNSGLQGVPA